MSKRRERELYSSTSSQESSPNPKNLKMTEQEGHVDEAPSLSSIFNMLLKVQKTTEEIRDENTSFRKEMLQLRKESSAHTENIKILQQENAELKDELKKQDSVVANLQAQVPMLNFRVNHQDELLDDISQYQRKYNVEIQGVPELEDEDLEEVVVEIAKELCSDIESNDIDIVHRQRSRIAPRPILVKFKCYADKKSFYGARKKLKSYNGDDEKINGAKRIYINEHLTVERKRLYAEVRKRSKQNKWYRVWTNDGKIFAQTARDERPLLVTKEADLEDIYG